LVAGPGLEPRT